MSDDLHRMLAALAPTRRLLAPGQILFATGDPVTHLFVVRDGAVDLCRTQRDGAIAVLQRAAPGDVLAEASMFSDVYHCDAVARGAARLDEIPLGRVRARMASDPGLSAAFLRHMAASLRDTRRRAEVLRLKTVRDKLNAWLTWQDALPPKGDWRHLADELGVSPEALYRELSRRRMAGPKADARLR